MRIEIEIPKEFECDYNKDRFDEFFCRVLSDISDGTTCGRYERENAEMLQKAFEESKVAYDVEEVVDKIMQLYDATENCGDECNAWNCRECYENHLRDILRNSGKE